MAHEGQPLDVLGSVDAVVAFAARRLRQQAFTLVVPDGFDLGLYLQCDDFGLFDSPDAFYARHGSNLSGLKRRVYERFIRHAMNRNVARVRASKW